VVSAWVPDGFDPASRVFILQSAALGIGYIKRKAGALGLVIVCSGRSGSLGILLSFSGRAIPLFKLLSFRQHFVGDKNRPLI
jgi:hypothetical protein